MLKALLKKQLFELMALWFKDRKTGKIKTGKSMVLMFVLMLVIFLSLGAAFFGMGSLFADAFISVGMDWMFFVMMGLMAIVIGTLGDIFNTYSTLYLAKDNDLLLSMPIKPSYILIARLSGVYIMGLIYEAVVFIPGVIAYFVSAPSLTPQKVIFPFILLIAIGIIVLVLSCFFGFVVAAIASRVKSKAPVTVALALAFIGLYYFCYFKLNSFLQSVALMAGQIGAAVQSKVYPVYVFGCAGAGDVKSLLLVLGASAAVFAIVYFVLSKSLYRILTVNVGTKTKEYKEKTVKTASQSAALLRRELRRLVTSPVYMLNTGLGVFILLLGSVAALIKAKDLYGLMLEILANAPLFEGLLAPIAVCVVCFILSMNCFTAPSVSLEGRSLWVLKSSPVAAGQILAAKERMCIILNSVSGLIATLVLLLVLKVDILSIVSALLFVETFILFFAELGLVMNLKKPNLDWTNENVAVKQSLSVLFTMFGGFLCSVAYFGLQLAFSDYVPAFALSLIFAAALVGGYVLLKKWVNTKGTVLFEEL